ncbi:MAG: hypothetical protein WC428_01020 [Candidatus Paceibacterota bacterium]
MFDKNLIKIINEEVSGFDFLGNEEQLKEQEIIDLLQNEDFQKQFICDSLLEQKNKIKIDVFDSKIGGDWEKDSEDAKKLTLEYFLKIEYKYDQKKEPVVFDLSFYSNNISISKSDNYDPGDWGRYVAPSGNAWFDGFNWNDINVDLNTSDGDEVKFVAFEKAPPRIKVLFIRQYVEGYIGNYTSMDISTPEIKDKIQNVPYC